MRPYCGMGRVTFRCRTIDKPAGSDAGKEAAAGSVAPEATAEGDAEPAVADVSVEDSDGARDVEVGGAVPETSVEGAVPKTSADRVSQPGKDVGRSVSPRAGTVDDVRAGGSASRKASADREVPKS